MPDLSARALRLLPPETAHRFAIRLLRMGLPRSAVPQDPRLEVDLFGQRLPHPLGLAAGFDKDAEAVQGLFGLGFSFVEVGTVTLRPQSGNPRPRLFRLREDAALINRMGFNNAGADGMTRRLAGQTWPGPLGVNIGINRDSADPGGDYAEAVHRFAPLADYLVINVSSPNTPGLRSLQAVEAFAPILDRILAALPGGPRPPLLVKIAPDLTDAEAAALAGLALDKCVAGLIVANTTLARPPQLRSRQREQAGGLSGRPLRDRAQALLGHLYRVTDGRLPLIGVGGIGTGADAYARIRAGASALQIYTALIDQGPGVARRILADLLRLMEQDGAASLEAVRGSDAR